MKKIIAIIVLVCSGCVSFPVFDSRLDRKEVNQDKNIKLPYVIAVRSKAETSQCRDTVLAVSNVVNDLSATHVFQDVFEWTPLKKADLIVEVSIVHGIGRCGTPLLLHAMSLGFISAETDYHQYYRFTLLDPKTEKSIFFDKTYHGVMYTPSILFIPFTFHKQWPTRIDLLRHDLTVMATEIDSLRRTGNSPNKHMDGTR